MFIFLLQSKGVRIVPSCQGPLKQPVVPAKSSMASDISIRLVKHLKLTVSVAPQKLAHSANWPDMPFKETDADLNHLFLRPDRHQFRLYAVLP